MTEVPFLTEPYAPPLPKLPTFIGICCREWILAALVPVGRCGLCGTVPVYLRPDK